MNASLSLDLEKLHGQRQRPFCPPMGQVLVLVWAHLVWNPFFMHFFPLSANDNLLVSSILRTALVVVPPVLVGQLQAEDT